MIFTDESTGVSSLIGWTPLGDRVIVRMADLEDKTAGGVFIPENAKQRSLEGTVLAVGPGFRDNNGVVWPIEVKPGDRIMYAKYAGSTIKPVGFTEEVLLLSEKDILTVKR